jgi:hypothetical protein
MALCLITYRDKFAFIIIINFIIIVVRLASHLFTLIFLACAAQTLLDFITLTKMATQATKEVGGLRADGTN